MNRSTRLRHETGGATAIEYAIIAGLIGLGLVGSLVTTRGSLSGVIGTASSQMGSAASGASTPNAPPAPSFASRKAYWEAKGYASAPLYQGAWNTYNFADGSKVEIGVDSNPSSASQIIITDAATGQELIVQARYGTTMVYGYIRDKSGIVYSNSFSGNPPVPNGVTQGSYSNAFGRDATAAEITTMQNAYYDFVYYYSLYRPN